MNTIRNATVGNMKYVRVYRSLSELFFFLGRETAPKTLGQTGILWIPLIYELTLPS